MGDPEKSASRPPKTSYVGLRMQRLVGLGSEASVVGFVWVGSILGGAGIGYLLDGHFHTSFWTPVLLLVGAALGFREMLVTTSRLNQKPKPGGPVRPGGTALDSRQSVEYPVTAEDEKLDVAEPVTRQRIFQVPAPPEPSFGQRAGNASASSKNRAAPDSVIEGVVDRPAPAGQKMSDEVSSSEALIKQLLDNEQPSSQ